MATATERESGNTVEGASWRTLAVQSGERHATLLVGQVGGRPSPSWAAIAAQPRPTSDLSPITLLVVLDRHPDPHENAIGHLVARGTLRLEVSSAAQPDELDASSRQLREPVQSLYIEGGTAELFIGDTAVSLTQVSSRGEAAIEVHLDAAQTLDVVDSLLVGAQTTTLRMELDYRPDPTHTAVSIEADWTDIYDALVPRGPMITEVDLQSTVEQLLDAGSLHMQGSSDAALAARLVQVQRAVILDETEDGSWQLRQRPWPGQRLIYTERRVLGDKKTITIEVSLADLAAMHSTQPRIDLVAEVDGVELEEVAVRESLIRRRSNSHALGQWVTSGPQKLSVPAVLAQTNKTKPSVLISASLANQHLSVLKLTAANEAKGPFVDKVSADSFDDTSNPNIKWWPPSLRLAAGAIDENVDDGRFRFALRRLGFGADGQPVLSATITVTLEQFQSSQSATAMKSAATRKRVDIEELAVTLDIPFIDAQNPGEIAHHYLTGTVSMEGDGVITTFDVAHDWVRLAYSVLADPSYHGEQAALNVAYTFSGFHRPIKLNLPLLSSALTFQTGLKPLRLDNPALLAIGRKDMALSIDRAEFRKLQDPAKSKLPAAESQTSLSRSSKESKDELAEAVFNRRSRIPIGASCADVPNRFVDVTEPTKTTIGCTESLELGQIEYQMFTARPDLSEPGVEVQQSTSQPHRFMVVSRYALGRREPEGTEEGGRPLFVVYAALDTDPSLIRVAFTAILHPEIRRDQLRRLQGRVKQEHSNAELFWPTEIAGSTTTFHWRTLDGLTIENETSAQPDGAIALSAEVDLPGWELFEAALRTATPEGSARVLLDDGNRIHLPLRLDPYWATGPREHGPVHIEPAGENLRLTNRVGSTIDINSVLGFDHNDLVASEEPSSAVLLPNSSIEVSRPGNAETFEVDYEERRSDSADLTEVRAFVEETQTEVIFGLLASLDARGRTTVQVEASIEELGEQQIITLTDTESSVAATFTLPLTRKLTNSSLQYRLVLDAAGETSDWFTHDLASSALIYITDSHFENRTEQ